MAKINKKAYTLNLVNILIGIFLIGGGVAYLANFSGLGSVIVGFAIAFELLYKFLIGIK